MSKPVKRLLALSLALLMMVAVACGQQVAATVNGEEITMAEYNRRVESVKKGFEEQGLDFSTEQGKEMEKNIREGVLDGLIEETLILQQAKEKGVLPTDQEIDEQLQQIKDSHKTEEEYQETLKNYQTTEEELRQVIKVNLASNKLYQKVTADVKEINIEQAREYYQQNQDMFKEPEKLEVRHILFFVNEEGHPDIPVKRSDAEAKKLAQQVIESLNGGADFASLAREKSEDTGSKNNGGIYTFAPEQGLTDPEFSKAAQNLTVGQYTKEPVRSQFGYHIIKLEKIIPAKQQSFEEVQQSIINDLSQKAKNEHFAKYFKEVKEKAKIEKKIEL